MKNTSTRQFYFGLISVLRNQPHDAGELYVSNFEGKWQLSCYSFQNPQQSVLTGTQLFKIGSAVFDKFHFQLGELSLQKSPKKKSNGFLSISGHSMGPLFLSTLTGKRVSKNFLIHSVEVTQLAVRGTRNVISEIVFNHFC